jgi:hypothetical protein
MLAKIRAETIVADVKAANASLAARRSQSRSSASLGATSLIENARNSGLERDADLEFTDNPSDP